MYIYIYTRIYILVKKLPGTVFQARQTVSLIQGETTDQMERSCCFIRQLPTKLGLAMQVMGITPAARSVEKGTLFLFHVLRQVSQKLM